MQSFSVPYKNTENTEICQKVNCKHLSKITGCIICGKTITNDVDFHTCAKMKNDDCPYELERILNEDKKNTNRQDSQEIQDQINQS